MPNFFTKIAAEKKTCYMYGAIKGHGEAMFTAFPCGVIYFIHQMAIHNAIKLLQLTSQTKLTLTVTLTLTDTVILIFTCTSLTPI